MIYPASTLCLTPLPCGIEKCSEMQLRCAQEDEDETYFLKKKTFFEKEDESSRTLASFGYSIKVLRTNFDY